MEEANANEIRNKEDIELIYQTLNFLGDVSEETRQKFDLRSLAISLCEFQERFSTPLGKN
jgi:hypothetical protein